MKPNYKHDCNVCQFLGATILDGKTFDLYYCAGEPTVIARWSDEGSEYASGLSFGLSAMARHINGVEGYKGNGALMVAVAMAMANGLDVTDRYSVTQATVKDMLKIMSIGVK